MRAYRLFGLSILSDADLPSPARTIGQTDLHITRASAPFEPGVTLFRCNVPLPDGTVEYEICEADGALLLRFHGLADFRLTRQAIDYWPAEGVSPASLAWILLGTVAGMWLDLSGWPVLHGAAVEVNSGAVGLLGRCGGGKSTLTASFLRSGRRVVADDHVTLESRGDALLVRPALPWLKVSADVAKYLGAAHAELPMLHPNVAKRRFDVPASQRVHESLPLLRLYTLRRERDRTADVSLERLPPQDALLELVRHSYSPRSIAAVGLQAERLRFLGELAERVSVWRVRYPAGLDRLDEVRRAVEAHAAMP